MRLLLLVERLRVFDQHAASGLGMEEADHAGQAVARFLIDQLDSLGARRIELARDVVGLEAYVMQSASAPREEFADRIVGVERLEQFDLALSRLEQRGADALLFNRRALGEMQAEGVAPEAQAGVEVRHHDADMMNLFQHRRAIDDDRGTASVAACPIGPSSRPSPA